MNHDSIKEHLAEYARGRLDPSLSAKVGAHLKSREECQDWTDHYGLLSASLSGGALPGADEHPESKTLAQFSVDKSVLDPRMRRELESHLESCLCCSYLSPRRIPRRPKICPGSARFWRKFTSG